MDILGFPRWNFGLRTMRWSFQGWQTHLETLRGLVELAVIGEVGSADCRKIRFNSRTIHIRLGALTVEVPQARDVEFYPSALEEGIHSDRALKLAVAEMYVQGVSTRSVDAITEQLCGLEVTSGQLSRADQALDGELEKLRSRPIGEMPT
jgi:transposase-like protein